jgi:nitrite reductase/ring-hydroxylating ferredoxin subunit
MVPVIELCAVADLPEDEGLQVAVEGRPPVAVFLLEDGEIAVIDDTCTHQDASLAQGWLEGCEVECPLHAAAFNLRTGVPTLPATVPVRVYAAEVRDGRVWADVSS